jgi:hypothetical protein
LVPTPEIPLPPHRPRQPSRQNFSCSRLSLYALYALHWSLDAQGTKNVPLYWTAQPRTRPLRHIADSRYTSRMDRVRFGRALGTGARAAAKSLISAAEAAAAPNPSASARPAEKAPERPAPSRIQIPDPKLVRDHARNLKSSVWSPFARFSSVLWLEVTGVFFLLFALVTGEQVWKWHAALRLPPSAPGAQRLYLYVVLFALFGYFTVSSFVRARRRQRR